jgi:uncharacterized cupin superfamily protein
MANVFEPHFDESQERPPFSWRRARLGRQAGSQQLGASLLELPPGASSFPLHIHHANEEMIIVLAGRPTLRTIEGERELATGELVACPAGRVGAHRIDNRSDETVRILVLSTMLAPEVNEYPDSGKVWARTFAPGAEAPDGAVDVLVRANDERVDYLHGEN